MSDDRIINVTEMPDSIDIGSPSKGGAVKVYVNGLDKEQAEKKIRNMMQLRALAEAEYNAKPQVGTAPKKEE